MNALQQSPQVLVESFGHHDWRGRSHHNAMFGSHADGMSQLPAREVHQSMFEVEAASCERAARNERRFDNNRRVKSNTHDYPQPSYRRHKYENMTPLQRQHERLRTRESFVALITPANERAR